MITPLVDYVTNLIMVLNKLGFSNNIEVFIIYYVYILFIGDPIHGNKRRLYTGYTNNLSKRILQHIGSSTTRGARTTNNQHVELAYIETYKTQRKAMQREHTLKKKSPYNTHNYKLQLIASFRSDPDRKKELEKINNLLIEFYQLLQSLQTMVTSFANDVDLVE